MISEENLKRDWEQIVEFVSRKFAEGERLDLDGIIYLSIITLILTLSIYQ